MNSLMHSQGSATVPVAPDSVPAVDQPSTIDNGPLTTDGSSPNDPSIHPSSNPLLSLQTRTVTRQGKVARLPAAIRRQVCQMIYDGLRYNTITLWLAENGHPGFHKCNLSRWREGGYQDWLKAQQWLEHRDFKRELALEQAKNDDPSFHDAGVYLAQIQFYQASNRLDGADLGNRKEFIQLLKTFTHFNRYCLQPFSYLDLALDPALALDRSHSSRAFYVGVDVARKHHLTVIDVGEKIGDVHWDRMRIEIQDKTFSEIEHELFRILELRQVKRCCIDATGLGMQLAERAKERFGWKVEGITFNPTIKEEMAFALRTAFEDRTLRIDPDPKLRSDLRGIKKLVTSAGKIRFLGEPDGGPHASGHCDRFWAKALRHHAATAKESGIGGCVIDDGWESRFGWSGGYTSTAGIISGLGRYCR